MNYKTQMTRFLSTIILISLSALSHSRIIFNYSSTEAVDQTPASFNVGVDFTETDYTNFSITEMKPRTDSMSMEEAGEFRVTLNIAIIRGTLTKGDQGVCNITLEHNPGDHEVIAVVADSPEAAITNINQAIAAVAEGVNYKSSWGVGPDDIQLNIKRTSTELTQAISEANCDTLNLVRDLLI